MHCIAQIFKNTKINHKMLQGHKRDCYWLGSVRKSLIWITAFMLVLANNDVQKMRTHVTNKNFIDFITNLKQMNNKRTLVNSYKDIVLVTRVRIFFTKLFTNNNIKVVIQTNTMPFWRIIDWFYLVSDAPHFNRWIRIFWIRIHLWMHSNSKC